METADTRSQTDGYMGMVSNKAFLLLQVTPKILKGMAYHYRKARSASCGI
jgi:hypothetical protein